MNEFISSFLRVGRGHRTAWPGQQVGHEGEQGRSRERLLQPGRWHKDGGGQPGRGAQRHWCHRMEEKEEKEEERDKLGVWD